MMAMQMLLSTDLGIICCTILNRIQFSCLQSLRNKKNAQQENDSDEAIPADGKNEL
jgi:hypothetical protein